MLLKEFCAENMSLVPAAIDAGAHRIELCDDLAVGGITPSHDVIETSIAYIHARNASVMVMVRPRGGSFIYSEVERSAMVDTIVQARKLGADGVVLGCLRKGASGRLKLDEELTGTLVNMAKGTDGRWEGIAPAQVTFHMAFDELDDKAQCAAIYSLAAMGVDRILTHGGPAGTPILDNIDHLRELVDYADGRITIMPGGGVTWQNAAQVAELLGVSEVHGTKIVRL